LASILSAVVKSDVWCSFMQFKKERVLRQLSPISITQFLVIQCLLLYLFSPITMLFIQKCWLMIICGICGIGNAIWLLIHLSIPATNFAPFN
jgi:hypothetical protein